MKHPDGIKIPQEVLVKNAVDLKKITAEKTRIIPIWGGISLSAAAAIALVLMLWNYQPLPVDPTVELSSISAIEAYDAGIIDLDLDLLMEYASPDDFESIETLEEVDVTEEELDLLLDEMSDEEIYNYLNS